MFAMDSSNPFDMCGGGLGELQATSSHSEALQLAALADFERPFPTSMTVSSGSRHALCMKCAPKARVEHGRGTQCGHELTFDRCG